MIEKKGNYFVRVLIAVYVIFLTYLVWTSFQMSQPKFSISSGIITVLLIMTILILSEAFDNLSIGKLLSISREVKKKEAEITVTKKENEQLRDNLIRVTTMMTQMQHQSTTNNNMMFPTEMIQQMLGVVKADNKSEYDETDEMCSTDEPKKENTTEITDVGLGEQNTEHKETQRLDQKKWRRIEYEAVNKYLKKYDISESEIFREVQFTPTFAGIDPIMERRIIFDAYLKTPNKEHFIEVNRSTRLYSMMLDRLYIQLAKIFFYRQAKNTTAELILILVELPDSYYVSPRPLERIIHSLQPAIASGLLRIETISFSEDDINKLDNEGSEQSSLF